MPLSTKQLLACGVALMILIGAGLVHGLWAERWQTSRALEEAAARVNEVPLRFGDWVGKDVPGDPAHFEQAGAQAHWMRIYTHSRTRASFLVILMCGRAGRMAVHTPEVCYQGAGFEMLDKPAALIVRSELGEELGSLWTARFDRGGLSELRLYWGWASTGPWEAARDPRWLFRGEAFLYKLYVSQETTGAGPGATDGPAQDFLRRLLPELRQSLLLSSQAP